MTAPAKKQAAWPEAMATVTACKYDFGAGRALAFGAPTSKHFRITFNYWATNREGEPELHTGEFTSKTYLPQGHLFPVSYNPELPHEHSRSGVPATTGSNPLMALGIMGSVVLSLAWLFLMRGCR